MYTVLCSRNCGRVWLGKSCGQMAEIIFVMKTEDWDCIVLKIEEA